MYKAGAVLLVAVILLVIPNSVLALSVGSAPGYPYASHFEGINEYFGWCDTIPDGVSWTPLRPGETATITFDVNLGQFWGVADYYYFTYWVDWNGDGMFTLPEREVIFEYDMVEPGSYDIQDQVFVPEYAVSDPWLRARLTWWGDYYYDENGNFLSWLGDTGLNPDGRLCFGEIEDHPLGVIPEPTTMIIFSIGLLGTAIAVRKKL
jgi:hypothetical protein